MSKKAQSFDELDVYREAQHWLMCAKAYGYIDTAGFESLWQQSRQVGRRLGAMLKSGDWS